MAVLLEGSPICTEELWSSVTSLTKALLPRLLYFSGWPVLGRFYVVPNFFHLGTFNAAVIFWYPSPDLCLDNSYGQFL